MSRFRNVVSNPARVCFIWVGVSVGVALIATPARFSAATITRPVALDVSRMVFVAQNKAELIALAVLLLVVRISGNAAKLWAYCIVIALIVLAQTVWLMPELSARTDVIIAGGEPPQSYLHATYSSLELVKIGVLLYLGFLSLSDCARTS